MPKKIPIPFFLLPPFQEEKEGQVAPRLIELNGVEVSCPIEKEWGTSLKVQS